ncbi:MAG: YjcG family protein [Planifilum sp.]|jgi:2'-5' RNA ligase
MKYGVAIFPQKKVQDVANSFRKRYDPRYTLIQPHITLKESFELDDAQLPEVVRHLERVADETAPFTIHFHKVGTFHPINNVVYLAITDGEPITRLHEKINSDPIYHERRFDYTPHLTIGQELSNDELHDIYGSLRMKRFDLTSIVDRFHLLYQLENESWTVYQSFLLKGKS